MDFSLDIVHILILLGTTLRNFPPIASRAEKVLWVAAVARWICARLKVERSSPVSPPRHGTIRAETAAWQPVRFQFKEREWDHTPPFTLQVFCIQNFTSLATFPLHMVPSWPSTEVPSLPTLTSCQALSTRRAVAEGFEVVTVYSKLLEEQLIFCSPFLPISSLYQDTIILNQISLYLRQITSESFT